MTEFSTQFLGRPQSPRTILSITTTHFFSSLFSISVCIAYFISFTPILFIYTMTEVAASGGPAEARKRRKEIMQSLRADGEEGKEEEGEALPPKKRKVSKKSKDSEGTKKTQVRYDPEVPMDKEQLAAWRKEARRVRNRESAAASRQRIRDRITELENEVNLWKQKYSMAAERLEQLERTAAVQQAEKTEQV